MGSFSNGVLVGLGISLFIAPMKGEEMRRLVAERISYLRSNRSQQSKQLQQPVRQIAEPVPSIPPLASPIVQVEPAPPEPVAQDDVQQTPQNASSIQPDLSSMAQPTGQYLPPTNLSDVAQPTEEDIPPTSSSAMEQPASKDIPHRKGGPTERKRTNRSSRRH